MPAIRATYCLYYRLFRPSIRGHTSIRLGIPKLQLNRPGSNTPLLVRLILQPYRVRLAGLGRDGRPTACSSVWMVAWVAHCNLLRITPGRGTLDDVACISRRADGTKQAPWFFFSALDACLPGDSAFSLSHLVNFHLFVCFSVTWLVGLIVYSLRINSVAVKRHDTQRSSLGFSSRPFCV